MKITEGFKIRSKIISELQSGTAKIDVYNSLIAEYGVKPIFERILNDIPSKESKEKYVFLVHGLISLLSIIALIKIYFMVLSTIKNVGFPNLPMITTLILQFLMIWMVYKTSRTGLITTTIVTGVYLFDYQKGIYHDDLLIRTLCVVIIIVSIFIIVTSMYLYNKIKDNWKRT